MLRWIIMLSLAFCSFCLAFSAERSSACTFCSHRSIAIYCFAVKRKQVDTSSSGSSKSISFGGIGAVVGMAGHATSLILFVGLVRNVWGDLEAERSLGSGEPAGGDHPVCSVMPLAQVTFRLSRRYG